MIDFSWLFIDSWFFLLTVLVFVSLLSSLVNLESLELRENLLKGLPESVAQLTKLERLDIGDNDIEELVSWLTTLLFV